MARPSESAPRFDSSPSKSLTPCFVRSTTRTLHFGTPSEREKRAFTRVLQGHIAIDSAIFPETTTGFMLDTWARKGESSVHIDD
jgi:hypothetical protein